MIKKPILSDNEKKKTFSAKKKQKTVLRNLLVQPFVRYWPELSGEDVQQFADTFQSFYKSRSRTDHSNVQNNASNEFDDKVILGLRSSIRYVSTGKRVALFISSKIRPKYVADQIITMTLTKNTNSKIFCVPNLDVALLQVLGFSCQCLAILDGQHEIWNWILEKSKQFPLPNFFDEPKTIRKAKMDVDPVDASPIVATESQEVDITSIHLLKGTGNERTFVPRGATTEKTDKKENNFISLGELNMKIAAIRPKNQMISKIQKTQQKAHSKFDGRFSVEKKKSKVRNQQFHTKKINYLPLKVNRVQPNIDKNKTKKKNKMKKNKN